MNFLALDLGTKTGFAYRDGWGKLVAGTWDFPAKKKGADCCVVDPRLVFFREQLANHSNHQTALVYEDVKFVRSQAQAHLWAGFRAVLWLFAHDRKIPTFCCPVQTLKKFATGKGNADKDAMALALFEKPETHDMAGNLDDNAVDAAHLLYWAESEANVFDE